MRKIFFALVMIVSVLPAMAQHVPHPGPHPGPHPTPHPGPLPHPIPHPIPIPHPGPNPNPGGTCQVVLVDEYNRILNHYYAQRDWQTGMCREGLRQCNYERQSSGYFNARCVEVRNHW